MCFAAAGDLEVCQDGPLEHVGLYRDIGFRVVGSIGYMSYSLNSLKGGYIGDDIGDYYRGY